MRFRIGQDARWPPGQGAIASSRRRSTAGSHRSLIPDSLAVVIRKAMPRICFSPLLVRWMRMGGRRMSPALKKFLQAWLINTLAVLIVTQIVHGIRYDSKTGLIVATLVLGVF